MAGSGKIFVSGATGNVGSEVARALRQAGIPFRAGGLAVERVCERLGKETEAVRFQFGEPATYAEAFRGITAMFLIRPPQITDVKRTLFPAIDAAVASGVKKFVFLSLIGIEQNTRVPHYPVEQYLRQKGVNFTFLRCSYFMQNLNSTHREEIARRSEIYLPAGSARTSFLDVRDIGAVAAVTLTRPRHACQAYDLTGPEALDYTQVAEQFSEVLGRKITYRCPSLPAFVFRQVGDGRPLAFALVMAMLYANTRRGMAAQVTGEVERITGREPIHLKQYIEDYRESWM